MQNLFRVLKNVNKRTSRIKVNTTSESLSTLSDELKKVLSQVSMSEINPHLGTSQPTLIHFWKLIYHVEDRRDLRDWSFIRFGNCFIRITTDVLRLITFQLIELQVGNKSLHYRKRFIRKVFSFTLKSTWDSSSRMIFRVWLSYLKIFYYNFWTRNF